MKLNSKNRPRKIRALALPMALLLIPALRAKEPTLLELEKPGIDKIAQLTARDHSTILFTINDRVSEYREDKLYLLDLKSSRRQLFQSKTSIRVRGWR
jgi:hypothetical protein